MSKNSVIQGTEDKLKKMLSSNGKRFLKWFGEKPPPLPPMNRKRAHEFAQKKLTEFVSECKEQIMFLVEEEEYEDGFVTKNGEEYSSKIIKKENGEEEQIWITKGGEEATPSVLEDEAEYYFNIGASYEEDYDGEKTEFIRVAIDITRWTCPSPPRHPLIQAIWTPRDIPLCRSEILHSHDLSIYEPEL